MNLFMLSIQVDIKIIIQSVHTVQHTHTSWLVAVHLSNDGFDIHHKFYIVNLILQLSKQNLPFQWKCTTSLCMNHNLKFISHHSIKRTFTTYVFVVLSHACVCKQKLYYSLSILMLHRNFNLI